MFNDKIVNIFGTKIENLTLRMKKIKVNMVKIIVMVQKHQRVSELLPVFKF